MPSLQPRGPPMRRREFITVIVGDTATWPMRTSAQQTGKLPTVGFLGAAASGLAAWAADLSARLRELGWVEGRTIAIEYRWSEGRFVVGVARGYSGEIQNIPIRG